MENPKENVHILYKKLGETPRECVERFKKTQEADAVVARVPYGYVPMTYAGRLDPMAEGVLVILAGDAIAKKEEFIALPKTYQFEMLWEFKTDTEDILGNPQSDDLSIFPNAGEVKKSIESSVGKFEQKYPAYSSQTVNGKSLIEWARTGRLGEIEIPSHEVEVTMAEYLDRRFLSGAELLEEIKKRIGLVKGDFRQNSILVAWEKLLSPSAGRQYALDLAKVSVSSGFYVRQFVSDLGDKFGVPATTFHILRTKVGDYEAHE